MSVLPKKNSDTLDTQKQMDKSQTVGIAENSWTEDFIKQTAEQFEKNLQNLLQSGEIIKCEKIINTLLQELITRW